MINLFFPKYCVLCSKEGTDLCEKCKKTLKPNLPECYICRMLSNNYLTHQKCLGEYNAKAVFVGWEYNKVAKRIMSEYKYHLAYRLSDLLIELLVQRFERTKFLDILPADIVVTSVSMTKSRFRDRGFNQAELIAKKFCSRFNYRYIPNLISRHMDTGNQALKDRDDRGNMPYNTFVSNESKYKNILVFDDVITTGTTLNRICYALKERNVYAICLFRGKPYRGSSDSKSSRSI